jgi:hypothetical protein
MTKPISPNEIQDKKNKEIPEEIVEIFNNLIIKNWNGQSARVIQCTAVSMAAEKLGISRQTIYDNHWMDVEPLFREAGWEVKYDKPGYCEDYDACFIFSKPRK